MHSQEKILILQSTPEVTAFQFDKLFIIMESYLSSFESILGTLERMNFYRHGSLPFTTICQMAHALLDIVKED